MLISEEWENIASKLGRVASIMACCSRNPDVFMQQCVWDSICSSGQGANAGLTLLTPSTFFISHGRSRDSLNFISECLDSMAIARDGTYSFGGQNGDSK